MRQTAIEEDIPHPPLAALLGPLFLTHRLPTQINKVTCVLCFGQLKVVKVTEINSNIAKWRECRMADTVTWLRMSKSNREIITQKAFIGRHGSGIVYSSWHFFLWSPFECIASAGGLHLTHKSIKMLLTAEHWHPFPDKVLQPTRQVLWDLW